MSTTASVAPPRVRRSHPAVWIALAGVIVGLAVAGTGGALGHNRLLFAVGGFVSCGAALLAAGVSLHRLLAIGSLTGRRAATWLGVASGVLAFVVALVVELSAGHIPGFLGSTEGSFVLAGPIEEAMKLALPLILLAAGPRMLREPRLGVWMVFVGAALFGVVEGTMYVANEAIPTASTTAGAAAQADADAIIAVAGPVLTTLERTVVELMHPFITVGAAALIWLAVARRRSVAAWIIGAFLIAAALHSFNDAVIGGPWLRAVNAYLPLLANSLFVLLVYLFWYRPQVRRTIPADLAAANPRRWRPVG
ncbi:PrsW family glutamic-type intramembrane protease [Herbiconiux sp. KACC 21604]|uniref:PrsW family glutamic-type intramembrane protease n=1 Tax=unclassified Herbiconiux TaxID=2618217 RepID=UPI001490B9FB|nr:PrsW family glutamic-type intramembrane protease [Herbiconiux sp. SALV-R1]QJU53169.1 PrsW family intramembrane metalloprotease [Herbiconiux sp. SALV-R1]WPO88116.1 PrsW family glutamic-type intramembrane protease [Herbiconiux sp. KACC 21604]